MVWHIRLFHAGANILHSLRLHVLVELVLLRIKLVLLLIKLVLLLIKLVLRLIELVLVELLWRELSWWHVLIGLNPTCNLVEKFRRQITHLLVHSFSFISDCFGRYCAKTSAEVTLSATYVLTLSSTGK